MRGHVDCDARASSDRFDQTRISKPIQELSMLSWSLTFLAIAVIAAVLGFAGLAGTAAWIAKVLFVVFLVMFVVSFFMGRRAPSV